MNPLLNKGLLMNKKTSGVKSPIKIRFMIGFVILIGILIATMLIFNNFFAEKFFLSEKQKNMSTTYSQISNILEKSKKGNISENDLYNKLDIVTSSHEVNALIVDSSWRTVYTNVHAESSMIERLKEILLFGHNIDEKINNLQYSVPNYFSKNDFSITGIYKVLEKTDNYIIQTLYDEKVGDTVFELLGRLPENRQIILRFAVASISDNIVTMNKIINVLGIILFFVAVIGAIIFSTVITKPITKLSSVASKMKNLEFDARYEDNDKSEIGLLGQTLNELSTELDSTIGRLKSANLDLQRDIELKEKAEAMQKEFLSDVSHELKTPIALIQGYAEALKEGLATDPESTNEYCQIIIEEAGKMNIMVRQLLSLSQIESGKQSLDIQRFCISDMISAIITNNSITSNRKGISIEFLDKDKSIGVWGYKLRIEQVVTNFITNAINYCENEMYIKIWYEYLDNELKIHIWNSGNGIPEDQIGNIWNKFFKVDKSRTDAGNGIGLSIVKAILDAHNKECGVQNTDGGIDFWFTLDTDSNNSGSNC